MSEETPDRSGWIEPRRGAGTIRHGKARRSVPSHSPAHAEPSTASNRPTAGQLLLALLVALVVTAIWRNVLPLSVPSCCDAKQYLTMAADPTRLVRSPYAHRVLIPYLTQWIGGDPQVTFERISLACMVATGPLVYALTRRLGSVHWTALLVMVGLLSSRAWVYYLYNPWLTDPAAMLLVAAAFLAIVSGWIWLLVPISIVFAGVRELFVGLAAPAFGWMRGRLGTLRAGLVAGLLVLPGWLVYRWIVNSAPSQEIPGGGGLRSQTIFGLGSWFEDRGGAMYLFVVMIVLSFGCWWVLAVMSLRDHNIRRLLWWLIPVFGQFLFGGDWGRFVLYAFPVVLPAAALTLQRLQPRLRAVIVTILGFQLLTPLLDMAPAERMRLNDPGPAVPVTGVLMAVTVVVLVAFSASGRLWQPQPVTAVSHDDGQDARGHP
jgi:hypothetical protein